MENLVIKDKDNVIAKKQINFTTVLDEEIFFNEFCIKNLESLPYLKYLMSGDPKDGEYYRLIKNVRKFQLLNIVALLITLQSHEKCNELLEETNKEIFLDFKAAIDKVSGQEKTNLLKILSVLERKTKQYEEDFRVQKNLLQLNMESYITKTEEKFPLFDLPSQADPIDEFLS